MLRIWLAMVSSLISGRPETRPGGPAGATVLRSLRRVRGGEREVRGDDRRERRGEIRARRIWALSFSVKPVKECKP